MNHYSTGFAITLLLCSYTVTVHGDCFKVTNFNSMVRTCEKKDHAQCTKYSDWGVFEREEDCCHRLVDGCSSCSSVEGMVPWCEPLCVGENIIPEVHTWIKAAVDEDCTTACSSAGLTCDGTFPLPTTDGQAKCVFQKAGQVCTQWTEGAADHNPSVYSGGRCYWAQGSGICSDHFFDAQRICGCII